MLGRSVAVSIGWPDPGQGRGLCAGGLCSSYGYRIDRLRPLLDQIASRKPRALARPSSVPGSPCEAPREVPWPSVPAHGHAAALMV